MGQEKTTLEIIAPTVDEAVSRGLEQLGINREAVDIEILDSGSKGLFGIGGRQARVRLVLKEPQAATPSGKKPDSIYESEKVPSDKAEISSEEDEVLRTSRETVKELLEKMKVFARVTAHYAEPEEQGAERQVMVDINGDDLSILIGRRTETLNALQYIASLIVSKELEQWVPLVIDIQGYRSRRTRQLQQLARRMAEQAVHTGKRQMLEPMPANERRIIHMELSSNGQVITESTGEEPNRKVTIIPKK
ncbi:MAG: KH domain-containing protein [Leptolinea sp.]|jgi:spoIIIJ-associated protein|nr:KH domain-containing protein [Leptolinea sp.]